MGERGGQAEGDERIEGEAASTIIMGKRVASSTCDANQEGIQGETEPCPQEQRGREVKLWKQTLLSRIAYISRFQKIADVQRGASSNSLTLDGSVEAWGWEWDGESDEPGACGCIRCAVSCLRMPFITFLMMLFWPRQFIIHLIEKILIVL